jgi:hypothetical protein
MGPECHGKPGLISAPVNGGSGILTDDSRRAMSDSRVDWRNRRVDSQFLPYMGEFDRIGQTPV